MSEKYPGGFVTLNPPTLDPALGGATPGVWTLDQALNAAATRSWPMYDPYYKYVTLNLHGNGTNGAQNNTFLDSSGTSPTITRYGNTTQGTFSPYGSLWSNYFNGSTDYLTETTSTTAFDLSSGNWTIESWIYLTSYGSGSQIINLYNTAGTNTGLSFYVNSSGALAQDNGLSGTTSAGTVSLNTWTHVAAVRNSGATQLYVNGIAVGSTISQSPSVAQYCIIGRLTNSFSPQYLTGYISNLRIVKGTAVYTSNFTPSTTPLTAITNTSLLTCQSNRFIDNSTNAFTITVNGTPSVQRFSPFNPTSAYDTASIGGSAYFDGTGDYLTTSTPSFDIRTNSFTFEGWLYPVSTNAFALVTSDVANNFYAQFAATSGDFYLGDGVTNIMSAIPTSTSGLKYYAWNYLAITFDGTTYRAYMNGTRFATSTTLMKTTSMTTLRVGSSDVNAATSNMYMSGFRYIKGTAQYTGTTMTVPTSPVTAVTNTSTLLLYTNAGIPDSAMMNDLETVGNAQVSTTQKKYGTASMYFNGGSDALYRNNAITLGSGDFTIECWVYRTALVGANYQVIFSTRGVGDTGGTATVFFGFKGDNPNINALAYYGNTATDATSAVGTTVIPINTWTHVAVVRSGSSIKTYISGVQEATATDANNKTTTTWWVGNQGTQYPLTAYIDDMRVTKGYARYTANFTPPTSQLQDQ